MRPNADESIRGEFYPINSVVPGMPVSEHLPLMDQEME